VLTFVDQWKSFCICKSDAMSTGEIAAQYKCKTVANDYKFSMILLPQVGGRSSLKNLE